MRMAFDSLKIGVGLVFTYHAWTAGQPDALWRFTSIALLWVCLEPRQMTTAVVVRLERRWLVYREAWRRVRRNRDE